MTAYTVYQTTSPELEHESGLTRYQAAHALLTKDGHRYEIRKRITLEDLKDQLEAELERWSDKEIAEGCYQCTVEDEHDGSIYGFYLDDERTGQEWSAFIWAAKSVNDLLFDTGPVYSGPVSLWRTRSGGGQAGPLEMIDPNRCLYTVKDALLWVVDQEWKGSEAYPDQDFRDQFLS